MQVFIAHAEADEVTAEELKEYLRMRGMHVQCESGVRGFRPLQSSDVVIGLWSQNTLFSTYRMIMERRLLEAWSEGRLVLVKLDHQFLPVGMRDLPSIDATFKPARQITTWPKVRSEAREAIDQSLRRRQQVVEEIEEAPLIQSAEQEVAGAPLPESSDLPGAIEPAPTEPTLSADSLLFVSYARLDTETVSPVVDVVEENGYQVWIDRGEITPGENWAGEIVRGIKSSNGVMIMCSPNAFQSDHIKREVYLADRYEKPMLPIYLEPAEAPEDFEYFFAGIQYLNLHEVSGEARELAIRQAMDSFLNR